jgi:hypothetical protein
VKRALLALVALAALIPFGIGSSSATFVAASANPNATFSTAADFNTAAVSLADPGTLLHATVALTATAASDRGLASVTFQSSPAGANTWTNLCVDNVAPYTCDFDTLSVADGLRDLRAVVLDTAGYSRESVVSARRVDNTAPATALTDPGSPLTGAKTLSATASDGGSGVASVELQYRLGSGSWTTICASTSCGFATASLADGSYDLRSLVTDAAGNTGTSVVSNRRIDNTAPAVTVTALPAAVRGTVAMAATLDDGNGAGVTSVRYQVRPASTGTWTDFCTANAAPFTCSGATGTLPDGVIDVRATATDGAALATTSASVASRIDNAVPSSASLTAPATNLSGTVTLNATAADAGSGIASVEFQRAPAGTSTWTTICTDTSSSYSCAWDTTAETDAIYDLRVIATDGAGGTRTSTTVTNRRVDNNGPTLSLTDPGSPLRGSVTLNATATDPAGVTSVTIQRAPAGTSTWTTICTDNTSAYSCAWPTTGDGLYDLRATAVDTLGRTSTSAVISSRRVDNTVPTGTDVQAVNDTGTQYRIDAGDVVTFSYSEAIAPASIVSGWNGSSMNVTVRVNNSANADTITIYNAANSAQLAAFSTLQLRANHVSATRTFAATAVVNGNQVEIRLGAIASGTTLTSTSTTAMRWAPSNAVLDLAGNAASTTTVNESGSDRDF